MFKYILAAVLMFGSVSQAAVIEAASCSSSAVQAAVNSASSGDTVTVPAGSCTWAVPVSIRKSVSLQGAGQGVTYILHDGKDHTLVSVDPGTSTLPVSISGFTFKGGSQGYWGGMAIEWEGPEGWGAFRIHHNTFNNSLWTLRGPSYVNGLIDNNTFKGKAYGMILRGKGDADWSRPLVLGTSDFFFVEDNTKNGAATGMTVTSGQNHVKPGRDFFNFTPKPGYTPFTYPHPLQKEQQ